MRPIELLPIFRERVWGRESLAPFFPDVAVKDQNSVKRIGEVWFTCEENPTSAGRNLGDLLKSSPEILGAAADCRYSGICPILVKLLFTTERLSVQVHPADEYARSHHDCLGKTEAWYVLDSQLPGEVAVGFREELTPEKLKAAAESGDIEHLLDWRRVETGNIIFTPAGTVHAIGAGLTICEIQQNSDVTYRLYDYGRPRELHLEHGAKVSHLGPHTHEANIVPLSPGRDNLVSCDYFHIERLRPVNGFAIDRDLPFYIIVICVRGEGSLDGRAIRAGQAWLVPAGSEQVVFDGPGSEWILTYSAKKPTGGVRVL